MALSILLSTFRVSAPLVFVSMGGILSERSGVVNIALEGLMLTGAFAAASVAFLTHSPWLGAAAGIIAGVGMAAVYALFVIQFRADQIVAGTAINLLAFGLTPLLSKAFFDSTGATPSLEIHDRFGNEPLYLALVSVVLITLWFKHSRLGLWVGFAGEHPEALSTAGIRVRAVRWFGVLAAGALAGLGGATLSIFLSSSFTRGMTAGRGFMALAALIFGKWKPIPTFFACLFFGLTDALQIRLQGVAIFGDAPIPVQFIQVLPYLFTILVLAGFMGKSSPPKALGAPWLGVFFAVICLPLFGCDRRADPARAMSNAVVPTPVLSGSRANGELLAEMIQVVFGRAPQDPMAFQAYHANLDQGGSLEGIVNGLTHSSAYREYEKSERPAKRLAQAFFIDEVLRLQTGASVPYLLGAESGKPLAKFAYPTGDSSPSEKRAAISDQVSKLTTSKELSTWFSQSSLPTLKRVLIEVILARLESEGPHFKAFYSETASRLAGADVDFGLALRKNSNPEFHSRWFESLSQRMPVPQARDRATWEILNREMRILNSLELKSKGG
ncbi:MAG: ABC transporter permease [Cryobacterium sp.]|nr:ABC transporter permease [Oligoflexia bacterium]